MLTLFISGILAVAGGPNVVGSTLKSATVYRSGAELVHEARAVLAQGTHELVIDNISKEVDQASIRVSTSGHVTVMAATFTKEYLATKESSETVKRLNDSVAILKREQVKLNIQINANEEMLAVLTANRQIGGNAGVNVVELGKMLDYYKQRTLALRTEIEDWKSKQKTIGDRILKLQAQAEEEDKDKDDTGGRIVLQLLSPTGGPCDLTISYMTHAAWWMPYYDLRVESTKEPMRIEYKAKLAQTSGLDWRKVKLSLSTSTPGLDGNAPVLKAWFLRYLEPVTVVGYGTVNNSLASNYGGFGSALEGRVAGLQIDETKIRIRGVGSVDKNNEPLYIIDGVPSNPAKLKSLDPKTIGKIETLKDASSTAIYGSRGANGVVLITTKKDLGDYISVNDNAMDVTFDLDVPYDVPGNGQEQGVVLKEYSMPCTYRYYSAPVVDREAYLLGGVGGWEKLNLLPGEANIIVEGALIGKSFIDPASTQDTLNLTLGRDKRIVVKKEKIVDYSSVKFLGSNKRQVFTYNISVRNNKKEAADIMLKDQFPVSSDKEIEVELLESAGAEVNGDIGVLSWKLQLAPGELKTFRVSYSVKYPKDKIVNLK